MCCCQDKKRKMQQARKEKFQAAKNKREAADTAWRFLQEIL